MSLSLLLIACSEYNISRRYEDPELANATRIEETTVIVVETETTDEDTATPETETETTEEPVDDCLPNTAFVIEDREGNVYTVPTYLEFKLSGGSRSGTVTDGYEDVLTIDATAHCGSVTLEHVLLTTTTDGDDIPWLQYVPEVMSGIDYEWDNMHVFSGYGENHGEPPDSSVTAIYWDHEFVFPITIPRGETFSFTLGLEFGDNVTPVDAFNFRLYPRYTWYGTDDPSLYPDVIMSNDVDGNELTYQPE